MVDKILEVFWLKLRCTDVQIFESWMTPDCLDDLGHGSIETTRVIFWVGDVIVLHE